MLRSLFGTGFVATAFGVFTATRAPSPTAFIISSTTFFVLRRTIAREDRLVARFGYGGVRLASQGILVVELGAKPSEPRADICSEQFRLFHGCGVSVPQSYLGVLRPGVISRHVISTWLHRVNGLRRKDL